MARRKLRDSTRRAVEAMVENSSQTWVANLLGIHRTTVYAILSGRPGVLSLEEENRIREQLGLRLIPVKNKRIGWITPARVDAEYANRKQAIGVRWLDIIDAGTRLYETWGPDIDEALRILRNIKEQYDEPRSNLRTTKTPTGLGDRDRPENGPEPSDGE